ncbi:MAG: hypothetical protein LC798_13660 [Chloroflexi bacterium]|nr:hypothetical protein [Chloroflexota bacterium]
MTGRATIHVVRASSGEYSARIEWPCAAHLDQEQARAHVTRASLASPLACLLAGKEMELRENRGEWLCGATEIYARNMGDLDPSPPEHALGYGDPRPVRYWHERTLLLERVPRPVRQGGPDGDDLAVQDGSDKPRTKGTDDGA